MSAPVVQEGTLNPGRALLGAGASRVHLIGIGGCGMRGAAAILAQGGSRITGSDAQRFDGMGNLVSQGAVVSVGHDADHLPDDTDLVVTSAAVPPRNPELRKARSLGIEVVTYAELVGRLMSVYTGVAVAGTHGKSTTTALTAYMYRLAGLDPSFLVGAESHQLGGGSGVGRGEHFIVESCEYAQSFLHHRPALATVLNIEPEHLDCYGDLEAITEAFASFAANVASDGVIVAHHAGPAVAKAMRSASARVETFGFEPEATWRAIDVSTRRGRYSFKVSREDSVLFQTTASLAGRHNVSNALAATALAWHGGAGIEAIEAAIRTFEGIERRMSLRGTHGGVTVIDDYAHHPTAIAETLGALRSRFEPRRTWVVFQPHQHSRTRLLMDGFASCFSEADVVLVPDIYSVRDSEEERRLTGSSDLVARMHDAGCVARYVPELDEVASHLVEELAEGDLVVTMGAGDVWKVADELVERVRQAN